MTEPTLVNGVADTDVWPALLPHPEEPDAST